MISGRDALGRIVGARRDQQTGLAGMDQKLDELGHALVEVQQRRAEDLKALARVRVDLVDEHELTGALDAAERQVSALLDRRADTLSGGEIQRVAIGRALLARPQLLLMDEPLVALDRERKATILGMIAELPRRFGLPVLFVSHLVEEIAQIADRLVALRDGRTVGQGPTVAMLERLGAEVTGHFEAGSLLEGHVARHDEGHALTAVDVGEGILWTPGALHAGVGERVRIRLRARDVALSLQRLEGVSIRNQLPARVLEVREEQGAYAEVRLDCGGSAIRARVTRLAVRELGIEPGLRLYALVKSVAFDRRLEV